jgi:predicted nucleic-acid-binding Zn-ribbon protein
VNEVQAAKIKKHKCPECGSHKARRSQMHGFWERGVLRVVGVRAYRCEKCDKRHFEFKWIKVTSGKLEG